MNRAESLSRLATEAKWDVLVIGGGATGLGTALDAAARGYRTVLVEQGDFAKGTSSRSTKLAHGGVRYLRSGQIGFVRGALRERGLMEHNAPHLVHRRAFVIPVYRGIDRFFFGFGLKAYEWLSGSRSFGRSRTVSTEETRRLLPTVRTEGLRGGVIYFDGQFDDARFALALAQTATHRGAAVVNYTAVQRFVKSDGRITGAVVEDLETGNQLTIDARVVVNATGVFTDGIRRLDDSAAEPMLTVSSGVHLVLDRRFLPGDHALMVPKTSDGRVFFALPWQGSVLIGTTDEPRDAVETEPKPLAKEIEFLLGTASAYLEKRIARSDVRSVYVGLRALVRNDKAHSTSALSRDHTIVVSPSGLVTVTGGKWTTYRQMAEDTVDRAAASAGLPFQPSPTKSLRLHDGAGLEELIRANPNLAARLHDRLPHVAGEVVWAARHEMARTVEDILARRTRILFLDARAAVECAPAVASLLALELGRPPAWEEQQLREFTVLAKGYILDA
ncbi:MAG TPA: glycerol-3-phosphate dehydrogenase/oxidase [Opitutaceae bacterium]|nr:glycerol-3-phosphate dehydrogenase/oxidase [Opitutaceae bacterium]